MVRKVLGVFLVAIFALSLAASASAAENIKGEVTKVEREGRNITIKAADGKTVTIRISGSRTELKGVDDRSEVKKGMKVNVEWGMRKGRNEAMTFEVLK